MEQLQIKFTGSTIGDNHKQFNLLVKETSDDAYNVEKLKDLSKRSRLELVYFAKVANHKKNAEVICQLLKSQDSMVVSYALQAKWFFRGITHQHMVNVEYFDKEIFPFVSCHTICRIISTLSSCLGDSTTAEHFYNYIHQWYGFSQAVKLLPKGSIDFIRSQIMNTLSDIPCAQMYYIYKKDRALALEYLENYISKEKAEKMPKNYSFKMNYNKIWEQLAEDDPKEFFRLMDKYPSVIQIRVGSRVVKKIMEIKSNEIIKDPKEYDRVFSRKAVISLLHGNDLETYLLNCLPAFESLLYSHRNDFFHLKPKFRLMMLMKLYPIKYNGASFLDRDDFLSWNLIEYLPPEERLKWVKKKLETSKSTDLVACAEHLCMDSAAVAIPKLKSFGLATNEWEKRSKFLEYAVECCKVNKDYASLLDLIKFVSQRHRNDNPSLRQSFLRKIKDSFAMHELPEEHWLVIQEMLGFLMVESVRGNYMWTVTLQEILKEYVHYCLLNGLGFEKTIDKIIENNEGGNLALVWNMKNKEFELQIFKILVKKYKEMFTGSKKIDTHTDLIHDKDILLLSELLQALQIMKITFDEEHMWIIDYIKSNHTTWNLYNKQRIFENIVKDINGRTLLHNEILEWTEDIKLIKNYVQHNPELIIKKVDTFIEKTSGTGKREIRRFNNRVFNTNKSKYRIYEKISMYLMDSMGKEVMKALKEHMNKDDVKESQQSAIDALYLCYLLPPQGREDLIKQYYPTALKVDLSNNQREYENGQIFGKYIKYLNPPVETKTMMTFVGGDYLKHSVLTLLSSPYRRSRGEAIAFINGLLNNPVSVRKHAVRLAYCLFPREDILPMYESLWENDKNMSIREVVFSFTYKLFKTELKPEKYRKIWDTLKSFMNSLNDNDKEIYKHLTKPQEIKPVLVKEYCETCWKVLLDLSSRNVDVQSHIINLTKNIEPCLDLLNEDLCEQITKKHLDSIDISTDNPEKSNNKEIFMILSKFLVQAKNIEFQIKLSKSICNALKDYIETNWNKKIKNQFYCRQIVREFILLCSTQFCITKTEFRSNAMEQLLEMLKSVLPTHFSLDLEIILRCAIILKDLLLNREYKEYPPSNYTSETSSTDQKLFVEFGEKLAVYLDEMCLHYGVAIVDVFSKILREFFYHHIHRNLGQIYGLYLVSGMISGQTKQHHLLMAVKWIVEEGYYRNEETHKLREELSSKILENGDDLIQYLLKDKIDDSGHGHPRPMPKMCTMPIKPMRKTKKVLRD